MEDFVLDLLSVSNKFELFEVVVERITSWLLNLIKPKKNSVGDSYLKEGLEAGGESKLTHTSSFFWECPEIVQLAQGPTSWLYS